MTGWRYVVPLWVTAAEWPYGDGGNTGGSDDSGDDGDDADQSAAQLLGR